jgi:hypothetical protein
VSAFRGNFIVIVGATAVVLALTWGGVTYPWNSYQVALPLTGGIIAILFFFYYEWRWAREPSVPFEILANSTSLSGSVYYSPIVCHAHAIFLGGQVHGDIFPWNSSNSRPL